MISLFTSEEEDYLLCLFRGMRPRYRDCYRTAFRLCMKASGAAPATWTIEYGEGLAGEYMVPHAVMLLNGKSVDLVWRPEAPVRRRGSRLLGRAVHNAGENDYSNLLSMSIKAICERIERKGHWGP